MVRRTGSTITAEYAQGDETVKIGVLGSGAGGTAVAFDWSAHGHDVFLFDFERFPDNVRHIAVSGRIEAEGDLVGRRSDRVRRPRD